VHGGRSVGEGKNPLTPWKEKKMKMLPEMSLHQRGGNLYRTGRSPLCRYGGRREGKIEKIIKKEAEGRRKRSACQKEDDCGPAEVKEGSSR